MDSKFNYDEKLINKSADPKVTETFLSSFVPYIISGDVEALEKYAKECFKENYFFKFEKLDQHLLSTPAMCLGMYAVIAYQNNLPQELLSILSKKYLDITSRIKTLDDLSECLYGMMIEFTSYVNKFKQNIQSGTLAEKCHAYVYIHIYEKISMQDIASYFGYSVSGLQHAYKKESGKSITRLIAEEKTERAKDLLISTGLSVIEISIMLGYSSESHFIYNFKKSTGISPSKYRKMKKFGQINL